MSAKFQGPVLFGLSRIKEGGEEGKRDKEFWESRHFLLNPFPMHVFWSVVYFDELNHVKLSNLILKLKQ